jgi:ATP adenylyltransferase
MKRLFSPWRSAYIASFKGEKRNKQCLFCRIAKEGQDDKNMVVWRGDHCYIVMNLFPYNSGHLMVVPYKHTSNLAMLSPDVYVEMMQATVRGMRALRKVSDPHGFNFGANLGRVAGAGIDKHVHFHVVPRWSGDTNFMPVLADVKLISEDLKRSFSRLKKAAK